MTPSAEEKEFTTVDFVIFTVAMVGFLMIVFSWSYFMLVKGIAMLMLWVFKDR